MATVKIKDIADKLGISPATVSMALNDRPGVNALTKKRVMELVKELNYTGGSAKKSVQNNGIISFLVYKRYGKIIADTQFFADLTESVETAARHYKYTVALTYCTGKDNLNATIKQVLAAQPEGLIVLGTELSEEDFYVFENLDIPVVVLDSDLLGCPADTVTIHNCDGVYKAVKYLKEQGHTDIGYLRSSFVIKNFEQRLMAFKYSMKKLGLKYDEKKIFMIEPTIEGACEDVRSLFAENVKFPEALVADNDLIALGVLKGLLQNGVKVPEEVSLIGFDDIPMASIFEPALTSVRVSRRDLGNLAVEQLIWRINNPGEPFRRASVSTTLTVRSSVKHKA